MFKYVGSCLTIREKEKLTQPEDSSQLLELWDICQIMHVIWQFQLLFSTHILLENKDDEELHVYLQ
jgi:hypothetical protein